MDNQQQSSIYLTTREPLFHFYGHAPVFHGTLYYIVYDTREEKHDVEHIHMICKLRLISLKPSYIVKKWGVHNMPEIL